VVYRRDFETCIQKYRFDFLHVYYFPSDCLDKWDIVVKQDTFSAFPFHCTVYDWKAENDPFKKAMNHWLSKRKSGCFTLRNYEYILFFINFETETPLAENGGVSVIGIVCGGCFSTALSLNVIENNFVRRSIIFFLAQTILFHHNFVSAQQGNRKCLMWW
jgi:hypothetical protein